MSWLANKSMPLDGVNLGGLGISASVKLPKSVTDTLKSLPQIREEAKDYVRVAETQVSRATAVGNSLTITVQTVGIAVVFGAVIAALLIREGASRKK